MIPARTTILGSGISRCDADSALQAIDARLQSGAGGYVCFTNAHAAVTGRRDRQFLATTNASFLSLADGKSIYWVGRARGAQDLGHVPGPDFMLKTLRERPQRRHYFYGSTPAVLARLVQRLRMEVPGLNVVGAHSPPFRAMSEVEKLDDYARIRDANAELVWVGLGAPKQELWMREAAQHLRPAILFGVGAAFDFHAGTLRRASRWIRVLGMEWLYRLCQEPRRLWRRYLVTNTLYLFYLLQETLSGSHREKPSAVD